jgi:hypothetical protein
MLKSKKIELLLLLLYLSFLFLLKIKGHICAIGAEVHDIREACDFCLDFGIFLLYIKIE